MRHSIACLPELPCNDFRHCDYCAKRRQARVAELAQLRAGSGDLTFATITGLKPGQIAQARSIKPGPGGLWSVEIGEKMRGLHVNLLFDSQHPLAAEEIAPLLPLRGLEFWSERVARSDVRNVAAYIVKREGIPNRAEYDGRLYGTWGTWRSARTIAQSMTNRPLVQAAALTSSLDSLGLLKNPPASMPPGAGLPKASKPQTRDEARALAARHIAEAWGVLLDAAVDKSVDNPVGKL